jgi:hypothetical protein
MPITSRVGYTKFTGIDVNLSGNSIINWSQGDTFFDTIIENKTYTFSEVKNGSVVTLVVKNNSAGNITLTFPTIKKDVLFSTVVNANTSNTYTFFCTNNEIYGTSILVMS